MVTREPNFRQHDPVDDGEEEGIDVEHLKEIAGFVLRAPRRRPKLALGIFTVVAALGVTIAATMPRNYNVEAKLLAQRNFVLPALSNPGRAVPREADNPTRNVSDMILRRDNIVALAKEAHVVERYYATRAPALNLKDRLLGAPASPDDRLLGIVATLEKKLSVKTDDSTVTISLDWPEPVLGYDIVSLVEKNFLEARYDDEVSMISDAISVLQGHLGEAQAELDTDLTEFQRLVAERAATRPTAMPGARPVAPGRPFRAAPRSASSPAAGSSADPDIAGALEDKRKQIRAFEEDRKRQIDALKQQIAQAELTLTPQHPTVVALQQKLDAASQPSPELAQLKKDERALMAQLVPPSASSDAPPAPSAPAAPPPPPNPSPAQVSPLAAPPDASGRRPDWDEDGHIELARSRLQAAVQRYQDVSTRLDSANIELEIARADFKYRYTVITPPEVPRKPTKPVAAIVGVASFLGAILLGLFAAAGLDWFSGRLLEPWQVRRQLKIDILGEFDNPEQSPESPEES